MVRLISILTLLFAVGQGIPSSMVRPEYTAPQAPFTIAGNLHFVGSKGLSAFLITTPQGHILIDSGLEDTAKLILANIRALGFKPEDVKILLSSHAHLSSRPPARRCGRWRATPMCSRAADAPIF